MTRHALWIVLLVGCLDAAGGPAELARPGVFDEPAPMPQTWRPLEHSISISGTTAQLMTDGTLMVSDENSPAWWRLSPDAFGGYEHGTWTAAAPGPSNYAPLYYGSATLPDGRLIIEGGEYNFINAVWTTLGAIYDPVANKWTPVKPPTFFPRIGDASSIVLPNGQYMLTDCCDTTSMAILDPTTLTWGMPIGDGKADIHDEESWAMMWDGRIITADANNLVDLQHSEIYDPSTQHWSDAGEVPVKLADTNADNSGSHEVGPAMMRPDGKVVAIGAIGQNAIYDPATSAWSKLPDLPKLPEDMTQPLQATDAPGVVMPNGDIMIAVSPGLFGTPSHFYELHDTTFSKVPDPTNSTGTSSYQYAFTMLPTGEVLMTDQTGNLQIYTPAPGVAPNSAPEILDAPRLIGDNPEPSTAPTITMYRGRSYSVAVHRMNGVTQGGYYGDDVQTYSNFPIVRVTNQATMHASYCRTYNHSDRSISPDEVGTTTLDIPATAEPGISDFVVIANGVASAPITVNLK